MKCLVEKCFLPSEVTMGETMMALFSAFIHLYAGVGARTCKNDHAAVHFYCGA